MKSTLFLILILFTAFAANGQSKEDVITQYEFNIQQEYINDVYIPSDVMDAMKQLDLLSNEEGRAKLVEAPEEVIGDKLILGLGRWMTVNWNFYEGSRISHALRKYGVTLPEDQAKFMIVSYHRYLRNVALECEQRGKKWFDLRKKEQEERRAKLAAQH